MVAVFDSKDWLWLFWFCSLFWDVSEVAVGTGECRSGVAEAED